jgi:hypothetical protein
MAKILALIILVLVFVPVTAFAQEYNQSMTGLITEGKIESDKAKLNLDEIRGIHVVCQDGASDRDFSIMPSCLEFTKAYNRAISKLLSENSDSINDIFNE